jgi:hypothetical protein
MVKITGRTPPSGRGELLEWINTLCCATYDSLEHLGDGVLYCQVLEMVLADAPCFLQKLSSFDCCCSAAGGASEGIRRERRERNLGLFQVMCRLHLPKRVGTEINTARLAEGKLQDHMILAKWLYSRVADAAKSAAGLRFVVDAELRRVEAACGVAEAEVGMVDRVSTGAPKPLASELDPPPDAVVRMRRHQLLVELKAIEKKGAVPPQTETTTTAPTTANHDYTASQYAPVRHHAGMPEHLSAADPRTGELLANLQRLLVAKSQRTAQLQQHLAQFVEMRNGLSYVTDHIQLEAERATAEDKRLAATVIHTIDSCDSTRANVFTVVGEALRP